MSTIVPPTAPTQVQPEPYYSDESVTLWHGDALAVLRDLPDASVDCCVTSPPYFGLRDYGVEGQYGLEASPAEYVETMRTLFAEVRRVLADDGTLWLNLGDSYNAYNNNRGQSKSFSAAADVARNDCRPGLTVPSLPTKSLIGIPWRVAFALQDVGWILRNDIIWSKPNAMPESVTDRLSSRHEHLFLFSKSPRYWFDLNAVREPVVYAAGSPALNCACDSKEADVPGQSMRQHRKGRSRDEPANAGTGLAPHSGYRGTHQAGRNPGDVWTVATQPFSAAHFAVMPQALAERAVLAGCKPSGTVLDPFSGSGTTGYAANKHGRKYVGIDLSADYLDLSLRTRFAQPGLDLTGGVGA